MGRRTFESIGRPLPGRTNIVLTRDPAWRADGRRPTSSGGSPADALDARQDVAVIGGAQVYADALPLATRVHLTEVHMHRRAIPACPRSTGAGARPGARTMRPMAPRPRTASSRSSGARTTGGAWHARSSCGSPGIVALAIAAFLIFGPGIAEGRMNRVVGGPWPVSARAKALHATLFVADMHADTLLWQRDFADAATRGHVDLPRLAAGNVALQVLSSVTKTPKGQNYESNSGDTDNITLLAVAQLQPVRTWGSLIERSLWHAEKLKRDAARNPCIRIIQSRPDLPALDEDRRGGGCAWPAGSGTVHAKPSARCCRSRARRIWRASSAISPSCTMPASAWSGWRTSSTTSLPDRCMVPQVWR